MGKVILPEVCIDNQNSRKLFSIQQCIHGLLYPYGPIWILAFGISNKNINFFFCSPPNGCLQYHTGIDGRFTTFNYLNPTSSQVMHLRNQNYRVCIRQEEGKMQMYVGEI